MLFTFCLFAYNQGLFWLTYSSVKLSDLHKSYEPSYYDSRTVALLLNWGPIFGILCAPFQAWLSSQPRGLYKACTLGVLCCVCSAALRYLPSMLRLQNTPLGFFAIHSAQILNALAGPLCAGMVSRLACVWFRENERKFATALSIAANGIGTNSGFILGPALGLEVLVQLELLLAVVSAVLFFGAGSKLAVEEVQLKRVDLVEGMRLACKHVDFAKVVVAIGLINGVTCAWQGVLQNILSEHYTSKVGGIIGAMNGFAGNIGAVIIGVVSRPDNTKRDLLIGTVILLICVVAFVVTVEEKSRSQLSLDIVFASATLAGFCSGLAQPLFYGLAARLIYPVNEGTSIGLIVLMLNIATLLVIFLSGELRPMWINYTYAGSVTVALLVICWIRTG